jgi:hypothetical protein
MTTARLPAMCGRSLLLLAALLAHGGSNAIAQPLRIGAELGPEELMFSRLVTVKAGSDDALFVLDRDYGLRWYRSSGAFGGRIGRAGRGPGELREPLDIAIDGAGRIHVLDPGNARISVYRVEQSDILHNDDQRINVPRAIRLCAVEARRFVLSIAADSLLHEIDPAGHVVRRFGQPVQPDAELARQFRGQPPGPLIGDGPLACNGPGGRLAFASGRLGEIRLYTLGGELLWRSQLRDFVREDMRYIPSLGTCCQFRPDPRTGTSQYVLGLAFAGDEIIATIRTYLANRGTRYEVRHLRLDTGEELRRAPSPMTVTQIDARGRWIGFSDEPFPHVIVLPPEQIELRSPTYAHLVLSEAGLEVWAGMPGGWGWAARTARQRSISTADC